MPELTEAPWFDELSDADKALYLASYTATINDMHEAARFLHASANMRRFPLRSYEPDVALQHFVRNEDGAEQAKATFDALAANVRAAGGSAFDRPTSDGANIHHVAELPFGTGRAVYRVTWIERP